jgi:hypothetical protein
MSRAVYLEANALESVIPHTREGARYIAVELDLTPKQRRAAIVDLLSHGISEQEAFEFLRSEFPEWFEGEA